LCERVARRCCERQIDHDASLHSQAV
jgi:hypothetical protein